MTTRLVERCRQGDEHAWAELYRAHAPLVARFVRRMLGPSAPVEDLVQQVFIEVFGAIHRFRGDAAVTTWLYGIARRVAAKYVRGDARRRRRDQRWAAETQREGASSAHEATEARQALTVVERAVLDLKESHRAVWVMRELEGLSNQDIGRALGIRVGTVRSRLFHARRQVLKALERASHAPSEPKKVSRTPGVVS